MTAKKTLTERLARRRFSALSECGAGYLRMSLLRRSASVAASDSCDGAICAVLSCCGRAWWCVMRVAAATLVEKPEALESPPSSVNLSYSLS